MFGPPIAVSRVGSARDRRPAHEHRSLSRRGLLRRQRNAFVLALIALLCIVGTQVVFWSLTFPANQQTSNWTALPANWMQLRSRWGYSHAASAVLNLVALGATAAAVVVAKPR
jgi:hypothetical protein